jgi:hypothetical protein
MPKGRNTSNAVNASKRGRDDNEGLTDEEKLWKALELFATPPWASRAGCEAARALWPGARVVREPAAGLGHIARPAADYFETILPTDIHDHGPGYELRDWLDPSAWAPEPDCDLIITNPPFGMAEQFVLLGLERARLGVALLVRLTFLEGGKRHAILDGPRATLTQPLIFSERVPMVLGNWNPTASTAAAYAWLFWSKVHEPRPMGWLPPGTRARLSRPTDPQDFGRLRPMSLFDEGT